MTKQQQALVKELKEMANSFSKGSSLSGAGYARHLRRAIKALSPQPQIDVEGLRRNFRTEWEATKEDCAWLEIEASEKLKVELLFEIKGWNAALSKIGNLLRTQAPVEGESETLTIEPVVPKQRKRFDPSGDFVEVFYTPQLETFLRIDNQTFQLVAHSEEDTDTYCHSAWIASMVATAINKLLIYSAKSTVDNRPMTIRLSEKAPLTGAKDKA